MEEEKQLREEKKKENESKWKDRLEKQLSASVGNGRLGKEGL